MIIEKNKAKIIVIDGCDGTGKETQSKLLVSYLESIGKKVKLVSFPNYESESSLLVRKFLSKELKLNNPFQRTMAYALDRSVTMNSPEMLEFMEDPENVIVCDRYTTASLIYDTVDTPNEHLVEHVLTNETIEHDLLHIPRPSLSFLFNLNLDSVKEVLSIRKETETPDVYESNLEFMSQIVNNIVRLCSLDHMTLVNCNKEDGSRHTVGEVHAMLISEVNKLFI